MMTENQFRAAPDKLVRLHPQQSAEIDQLALGVQFVGAPTGGVELRLLRRRHAPAHHAELADATPVGDR